MKASAVRSNSWRPIGSGRNTGSRVLIHSTHEKKWRDRLITLAFGHPDWVLGFQDEVWWSRRAQPNLPTWTAAKPLRLLQNEPDRHAPAPKALACNGLLRTDTQGMLLRFVAGRPVSAVTTPCLGWLTDRLAAAGKTAWLLVWDNASWHISQAVRAWRQAPRSKHASWRFRQLRAFIVYKAQRLGVLVLFVDPRNTSRTCARCGLVEKRNRRSQAEFSCLWRGYTAHADLNAAKTLATRGAVKRPALVAPVRRQLAFAW